MCSHTAAQKINAAASSNTPSCSRSVRWESTWAGDDASSEVSRMRIAPAGLIQAPEPFTCQQIVSRQPPSTAPWAVPLRIVTQPSLSRSSTCAGEVHLLVPVEHFICPRRRRLVENGIVAEPRSAQVPVGVGQHVGELAQLGDKRRAVERAETGVFGQRPVQHGRIGVALEDLGVLAHQLEVQEGKELVRVIAANAGQHDRDLVIGECCMEVLNSILGRS